MPRRGQDPVSMTNRGPLCRLDSVDVVVLADPSSESSAEPGWRSPVAGDAGRHGGFVGVNGDVDQAGDGELLCHRRLDLGQIVDVAARPPLASARGAKFDMAATMLQMSSPAAYAFRTSCGGTSSPSLPPPRLDTDPVSQEGVNGMGLRRPESARHPIHDIHRIGAAVLGTGLWVFAVLGFAQGLEFLSIEGGPVMGLSSNGLLSAISLVVGTALVAAAVRGGPAASMTAIVVGILFLLSGLGHLAVLGTAFNVLAFRLSNVFFSLIAGMLLLFLGAYGRLSAALPPDNPYSRVEHAGAPPVQETAIERATNAAADREMASAERAVALGHPNAEEAAGVRVTARHRSHEDRRRAWQRFRRPGSTPPAS